MQEKVDSVARREVVEASKLSNKRHTAAEVHKNFL